MSTVTQLKPKMLTVAELVEQLSQAKEDEKAAKELRLDAEAAILKHPDVITALKPEGTITVENVKVATGFTRKWDQKMVTELARRTKPEYFPFRVEYKEARKDSKFVEERFPELWTEISKALTLTPKKPTITITEDKTHG